MRREKNLKPVVMKEYPEYLLVRDEKIPSPAKENIVLKPAGLEIIARHYFQKYGMVIHICPQFLKIHELSEKIKEYLSLTKTKFPAAKKLGFIFISNDDPDDIFGHALPMIWESDNAQEHLFFLDTTQYLGETASDQIKPGVLAFRQRLLSLIPNMTLWSIFGRRQIDYSSCYTDALVILKDGLLAPSLKSIVEGKVKEAQSDITIFYAPEILLRTAQIASYPEKSRADFTYLIHQYRENSENRHDPLAPLRYARGSEKRQQYEKRDETLADFRARFDEPITVNGSAKKFGTFTLFKAQEYAVDIERQKLAGHLVDGVLREILS